MANYYLASFVITDKKYLNPYLYERKKIYFKAETEQDVDNYIKEKSIHSNGCYTYTITPCKEEDLKGQYPTDGFYCVIIPKDDVIGKIDITKREFLVEWEKREHDGEYARVLRRESFIVTDIDGSDAGRRADDYAHSRRFAYYDDYTFYTITEDEEELAKVKESGKFIKL